MFVVKGLQSKRTNYKLFLSARGAHGTQSVYNAWQQPHVAKTEMCMGIPLQRRGLPNVKSYPGCALHAHGEKGRTPHNLFRADLNALVCSRLHHLH